MRPPTSEEPEEQAAQTPPTEPGPLAGPVRMVLFVLGSVSLLVGLVGLALPIIPQTIPLALGIALLSLASDWVYAGLRRAFHRWPRAWHYIQTLRHRLHGWLERRR